MKEKCAKIIVKMAEKTAIYASGKASVFHHYQPKEPKCLSLMNEHGKK